jgi:hypothetical protein
MVQRKNSCEIRMALTWQKDDFGKSRQLSAIKLTISVLAWQ